METLLQMSSDMSRMVDYLGELRILAFIMAAAGVLGAIWRICWMRKIMLSLCRRHRVRHDAVERETTSETHGAAMGGALGRTTAAQGLRREVSCCLPSIGVFFIENCALALLLSCR